MKNMKVRTKMFVGFFLVTIFGLMLGVVGIVTTQMIERGSEEVASLQEKSIGAVGVLNAHYIWRHNLTTAVMLGEGFTGSLDPDTCALGKWLGSDEAKSITDVVVLDLLRQIDNPHRFIHSEAKEIVELLQTGKLVEANEILFESILPRTQEVITSLTEIQGRFDLLIAEKDLEILAMGRNATIILVVLIVIAAMLSFFLAIYISNLINRPLTPLISFLHNAGTTGNIELQPADIHVIEKYARQKDELGRLINSAASFVGHVSYLSKVLERIADKDFTPEVNVLSDKDTIGLSVQKMIGNMNEVFSEIQVSTGQVATGSKQVADGSQALAQGATEQAASIEELLGSIAEINERTKASVAIADKSLKLSNMIKENAEKGSRQMDEMIAAVHDINEASQSISKIIKTINDIAFQTNILALNAAVEAARAGEHGKGFAVVAEEVRNLASKSAEAASDTGSMIQNSIKKAELGYQIAGETAASLTEIVIGINESSQLVADIAESSEEQSVGISQINTGVDLVSQVVQQNSATAEESAAASQEMSGQSDILHQLIAQFKLKDDSTMN